MATSAECRGDGVRAPEPLPDADEPDDAPSSPGEKRTMIEGLQSMIENQEESLSPPGRASPGDGRVNDEKGSGLSIPCTRVTRSV